MKINRKIIEIDEELCDGCGQCITGCAEAALQLVDGKAKLVAEKFCDGLGACIGECPTGALTIVERESEDFDEAAVEQRIAELESAGQQAQQAPAGGCPGAAMQTFGSPSPCQAANVPVSRTGGPSALSNWPVQIKLVPPNAPFLKDVDLLVAADCCPVAYPNFHADFLDGKVIMVGCPKFDNAQEYIEKFGELFKQSSVKSVTAVVMEVPCCSGLPIIVQKGMEIAGKQIPMERVVISVRGELLSKEQLVA